MAENKQSNFIACLKMLNKVLIKKKSLGIGVYSELVNYQSLLSKLVPLAPQLSFP